MNKDWIKAEKAAAKAAALAANAAQASLAASAAVAALAAAVSAAARSLERSPNPKREVWAAPTLEEVSPYCAEQGIDPGEWFDYYTARGWRLSNNVPMKDWRASVRTWAKKQFRNGQARPGLYDGIAQFLDDSHA